MVLVHHQPLRQPCVLAFPVFLIARETGLRDTHLALILMYLTFTLPIVIWICTDQFRGIPRELDEARCWKAPASGRSSAASACPGHARGRRQQHPVLHLLVE